MAKVTITEEHLEDIADAIREKLDSSSTYTPAQMAAAIESIPTGGITPTGTINISQNGTTDVTQYASADVNVPNSYTQADEGKVVSNGALVAQTARASEITSNGTYDTTENNSVIVNVSGGGTPTLQDKTITQNGTYTADAGYDGLGTVTVNVSGGGGGTVIHPLTDLTIESTGWTIANGKASINKDEPSEDFFNTATKIDVTNYDYIVIDVTTFSQTNGTSTPFYIGLRINKLTQVTTSGWLAERATKTRSSGPERLFVNVSSLSGEYYLSCTNKLTAPSSGEPHAEITINNIYLGAASEG